MPGDQLQFDNIGNYGNSSLVGSVTFVLDDSIFAGLNDGESITLFTTVVGSNAAAIDIDLQYNLPSCSELSEPMSEGGVFYVLFSINTCSFAGVDNRAFFW